MRTTRGPQSPCHTSVSCGPRRQGTCARAERSARLGTLPAFSVSYSKYSSPKLDSFVKIASDRLVQEELQAHPAARLRASPLPSSLYPGKLLLPALHLQSERERERDATDRQHRSNKWVKFVYWL